MDTQICYINSELFTINDFLKNQEGIPKNIDGDELILCNGPKIKPYFRRKNFIGNPSEMTQWHKDCQECFSEYQLEKSFNNKSQIKHRRTDVDLDDNTVIEFQYSSIDEKEVNERKYDYDINKKK